MPFYEVVTQEGQKTILTKLKPQWLDYDEDDNVGDTIKERRPAVKQASNAFQHIVGIQAGQQMIVHLPVTLWELPQPPMRSVEQIMAKVGRGATERAAMTLALQPYSAAVVEQSVASPHQSLGPGEAATAVKACSPPPEWCTPYVLYLVKTLFSQAGSQMHPSLNSPIRLLSIVPFETTANVFVYTRPRTIEPRKPPIYWYSSLSHYLAQWIKQKGTIVSETYLTGLKLGRIPDGILEHYEKFVFSINGSDHDKIKITRITLPSSAQKPMAPPLDLDWVVIEARPKEGTLPKHGQDDSDGTRRRKPAPQNMSARSSTPYWILAFPVKAITGTGVSAPDHSLPEHQHAGFGMQQEGMKGVDEKEMHTTRLVLGIEGKLPLLHGRGLDRRFIDWFMVFCGEGKGLIVLESSGAIPL